LRLPIFYDPRHAAHDPQAGFERARRGALIHAALQAAGLGPFVTPADWGLDPLTAVHTPALIHLLQTAHARMAAAGGNPVAAAPTCFAVRHLGRGAPDDVWAQLGYFCSDTTTPILAGTWPAAYGAAQVALSAARALVDGAACAYALCRPPGHHAYADLFGGYCYLNNAAIAAQWLAQQGRRVAILDVDYHHGNGTQAIFYARADVFFCSLHADPAAEYPFYAGYAGERGEGAGEGYTLNLPLPQGTAEPAYLAALAQALEAVARFAPDALLISLGLDTAVGDPEGGFLLTTASFAQIGARVAALGAPTLVVQEGGYLLPQLGENVAAFLGAMAPGTGREALD